VIQIDVIEVLINAMHSSRSPGLNLFWNKLC